MKIYFVGTCSISALKSVLATFKEWPLLCRWIAFHFLMARGWVVRDEGVGTLRAASEVSYSQKSRQSRKRLRAIYNFVRFVRFVRFACDYNPMCSPDAARRRPYLFNAHCSQLITQNLLSSVESVSSACHPPHLSKNKKMGFRLFQAREKIIYISVFQ